MNHHYKTNVTLNVVKGLNCRRLHGLFVLLRMTLVLAFFFLTSCEKISKDLGLNVNSPETAPQNVLYGYVDDAPRGSSDRHMGVIDGYTITVRIANSKFYPGGPGPSQQDTSTMIEEVRFLGIKCVDRPDIYPFGPAKTADGVSVSEYDNSWTDDQYNARSYVFDNVWHKWVKLEFDTQMRDGKGRLLAYVYANSSDGYKTFLNKELLKDGKARIYINAPNYKYSSSFRQLQQEAQNNKKGMWAQ